MEAESRLSCLPLSLHSTSSVLLWWRAWWRLVLARSVYGWRSVHLDTIVLLAIWLGGSRRTGRIGRGGLMCVVGVLRVLLRVLLAVLISSGPSSSVHGLTAKTAAAAGCHAAEDEEDEEDGEDDEAQEEPTSPVGPDAIAGESIVVLIVTGCHGWKGERNLHHRLRVLYEFQCEEWWPL